MTVKSAARRIQGATKVRLSSYEDSAQSVLPQDISSESEEEESYKEKLKALLLRSCHHIKDSGLQINPKKIQWIALKEAENEALWEDFAEGKIDRQFQIGRITNFFT